ncbi:DUF885 domain-containing protein [Panacagrimonas sp.]|uniref:DUF885 domain-containing protein n=1 Tax=Panacagrimonas sp. TaxID=2480088 RepID=UPI003B5166F2
MVSRRIKSWPPAVALCTLLLAACEPTSAPDHQTPSPGVPARAQPAAPEQRLQQLFDETWQRRLAADPAAATYLGDMRFNDRWEDLSEAAIEADHAQDRLALERLAAIDRAVLPAAQQLDYDLFRYDLEDRIAGFELDAHLMPLNQLQGVQLRSQIVAFSPFATAADYDNWLARLQSLDELVDQTIALLRRGIAEGRMPPRIVMRRVLPQLAAQQVQDAADSAYYTPFQSLPEGIPAEVRVQLELAGQSLIADVVVPAYARLQAFLEQTYIPACPENDMGLSAQPRGSELYAHLVRHHTSSDLSADAIHELGVREVARIEDELTALMRAAGHQGSAARFKEKLSWNPRYAYDSAAALLGAYRNIAKRIDPELPRLFGRLPRTPYGVREIDEVAAPSAPAAYYYAPAADGSRAGFFYANTYRPKTRAGWEMEALTAHEAVPGHHLQIALAQELEDIPDFRRLGLNFSAFVEGWALYAESLGPELGLYQDYGSRFGRLTFEMWRAVRLVVDTGLHAKGWSRKKAREYFAEHVPKSEDEIAVEVDRYIAMPGQALAYKIGELKIRELRRTSQERLGERFDIRGFHDAVLGQGALPLPLLERQVQDWADSLAQPPAAVQPSS